VLASARAQQSHTVVSLGSDARELDLLYMVILDRSFNENEVLERYEIIYGDSGYGFKVGVPSRMVETSPDSPLLIKHERFVQVMDTSFRQYR